MLDMESDNEYENQRNCSTNKIYWALLRFLSALARTPPKTNIVALFERNSGKSD